MGYESLALSVILGRGILSCEEESDKNPKRNTEYVVGW